MKRLLGACALALGCLGLLATVAAVVAVWLYREPVQRAGVQAIESVNEALQVVEEKTRRAGKAVRGVRQAVEPAARTVLRLAEKEPEGPEHQKELRATAEDLRRQIVQVEALLATCRQAVDLVNRTADVARKLPGLAQNLERVQLSELGGKVSEALDRMTGFMAALDEFLAEPGKDKQTRIAVAKKLVALVTEFEVRARALQDRLDHLQGETATLRQRLAVVQADLPGWTYKAALILTAILVWFGAGQGALMWLGRALLRKKPATANQAAPAG